MPQRHGAESSRVTPDVGETVAPSVRAGNAPLRPTPPMRAFAAVVRGALRAIARVHVSGTEHVPRSGPLLVVANHASNVDGVLIAAWLQPALDRPIRFLAKEQLFRTPLRPLLEAFGTIMVRAGGSDVDAYRLARAALKRGEVVGVFPEGSRSPDGVLREAFDGVTLLAARTGASVLPVGLTGTDRFLPRGSALPRLGARVALRIGQPFRVNLDASTDRRAALARATEELMGRVAELLPEGRGGRYATARPTGRVGTRCDT
jgi:1-acyl-sn-glycerol-3-phosphate acyltransferase